MVDDQRNNLLGEKEQRFQGSVGTQGRECTRMCVCVCSKEEIPVFFEIKARGGNIDGKLEKLVSIVFMS